FEISDAARRRAAEVFKMLTSRQLVSYLNFYGDAFPDPVEQLLEALDKVRGLEQKEWKQLRESVSEDVGRMVGGVNIEKAGRVSDRVVQWLIQVRALSDDEFQAQRPELEKKARQIVGETGPLDIVRNAVEYALAELLSNPGLKTALAARLKGGL